MPGFTLTTDPSLSIYRLLDTNGDGTGTKNANGNYSSVAEEFYIENTDVEDGMIIERMLITLQDGVGMRAAYYGNLGGPLTNGWEPVVKDDTDSVILRLGDNLPIKTNAGIGRVCYDVDIKTWGAGDDVLVARWTFGRSGQPLFLPLGYKLAITFSDDLSGLVNHYFTVQGFKMYSGQYK
jgi:hypothetical protein